MPAEEAAQCNAVAMQTLALCETVSTSDYVLSTIGGAWSKARFNDCTHLCVVLRREDLVDEAVLDGLRRREVAVAPDVDANLLLGPPRELGQEVDVPAGKYLSQFSCRSAIPAIKRGHDCTLSDILSSGRSSSWQTTGIHLSRC